MIQYHLLFSDWRELFSLFIFRFFSEKFFPFSILKTHFSLLNFDSYYELKLHFLRYHFFRLRRKFHLFVSLKEFEREKNTECSTFYCLFGKLHTKPRMICHTKYVMRKIYQETTVFYFCETIFHSFCRLSHDTLGWLEIQCICLA